MGEILGWVIYLHSRLLPKKWGSIEDVCSTDPEYMTRPVNLRLTAFHFPVPAVASIAHRITGVVLLPGIGYLTWLIHVALSSADGFEWVKEVSGSVSHGALIWLTVSALIYHVLAGFRHLLLDIHLGESLRTSRRTAWAVLVLSGLCSIVVASWLVL